MELISMPIASLKNVSKRFGETEVLKNISLEFEEGKFTCLLGASGSGKTTILRLLAGLEKPDAGEIYLHDNTVSKNGEIVIPASQREIGFIFQDLALWPHMTVYENIAFGLKIKKMQNPGEKIEELLDFFNLKGMGKRYPSQLSGGQQQLAAIARSLALNPKILLMDEPLASLDVKLKSKIRAEIKGLTDNFSVSVIYVTHDHHEAFRLADQIIVINEGKIEAQGTPVEIKNSQNPFIKEFIEL
jgi:ABC-type Fe3+/spermidine/putrescine transport system ATPase subunit